MLDKFLYAAWSGKVTRAFSNYLLVIIIASALLFYKLATLVPSLAYFETPESLKIVNFKSLINDPLNLLTRLPQYVLREFDFNSVWVLRGVPAMIGVFAVVLFYTCLRHWHPRRISLLGTSLFASSSWFLHTARIASPDVLQLFILVWLAYGLWLIKIRRPTLAYLVGCLIFALSLYIPGYVWVALLVPIWQRRRLRILSRKVRIYWRLLACFAVVLLLVPLWWSFINHPRLILDWLGMPKVWPELKTISLNLIKLPLSIFISAPANPHRWLDNAPILDIFSGAMFLLGIFAAKYQLALDRTKQFGLLFLAGGILISINGAFSITFILPLLYIIATSGIAFMLKQWLTIFPRNPAAAYSGVTLIIIGICLSIFFQIKHYFIAWPKAPETKQAYQLSSNYQTLPANNWYNTHSVNLIS